MNEFFQQVLAKLKEVRLNQNGLELLSVSVRNDPENSRLIVTSTNELGIDLPGDTLEKMISSAANTLLDGGFSLGNSKDSSSSEGSPTA